ncbi:BrnA antitoxin family protein [Devosia lacusdianchii]|uniref:BrnA antitoxin family protein n=1 Tax=Devosia lacusdianchii TaxID=2917991 RepID=UPI001F055C79|nr:BrnA antitoxin family protein [Devosia sp. JXJ CY 41]
MRTPRRGSAFDQAEAAFKAVTSKPVEAAPKTIAPPSGKEMVTLRLDRAVLEHFQEDGPGWQDRINAALRQSAGLDSADNG